MRCTRQISSGCVAELVSGLANSDISRKEKHILVGPIGSARLLRSCQTALKLLRSLGLEAVPAEVAEKLRSVLIERLVDLQQSGGSDCCLCLAYLLLVALCRSDLPSLTLQSLTGQPTDRAAASSQLAFWNALLTQDAYLSRRGSVTPNDDEVRDSSCSIDVPRLLDCLQYALQLNSVAADPLLLSKTILLCYEALLARSHQRLLGRSAPPSSLSQLGGQGQIRTATGSGGCAAQTGADRLSQCAQVVAVRQSREHVLGYYRTLFLALVPHCESPSTWLDALVKGVDNASDGHLLSIRDHFLQKLVRLKQPEFLSALCQAQYRKQRHRASRVKLLILSAGLKRVRLGEKECGILASLLRPACFWLHSR
uniref:DUF2428 domain-containing protein n=1 Tax=Macrostomum lignano TaxID=282301 RepID=A0A1I8I069_9PLAT